MQPWTIGSVLGSMLDTFIRRPFSVILILGLLPAIWMAPANLLQSRFVPQDATTFGPGRTFETAAISWLCSAWSCIWYAGQISAAIALARGDVVRWRPFVTGVRKAPALFLAGLIMVLPLDLAGFLPLAPDGAAATLTVIAAAGLTVFLFARSALSQAFIVASSHSLGRALAASWSASHGQVLKLGVIGIAAFTSGWPLMLVEGLLGSQNFHATSSMWNALFSLSLGHLYLLTHESQAQERGPAAPVKPLIIADDLAGQRLPEYSNFHLSVRSPESPARIAELYRIAGWTSRASAWNEFEVRSPIGELIIEGTPVVVHGSIVDPPKSIDLVLSPLVESRIDGFCECYGPDRELLFKRDFAPHVVSTG